MTKTFLERFISLKCIFAQILRRKGTVAANAGSDDGPQKTERSGRLLALEKEQSREFREHYLGQEGKS